MKNLLLVILVIAFVEFNFLFEFSPLLGGYKNIPNEVKAYDLYGDEVPIISVIEEREGDDILYGYNWTIYEPNGELITYLNIWVTK